MIEDDSQVFVFDYKTKQGMSVAEIKGETKNSIGDYFRQLAFYELLLADDPYLKMKKIITALVFISPDKKDRCPTVALPVLPEDIKNLKEKIQSVIDSVWGGKIANAKCSDPKCEWCGLAEISHS